MHQQNKNWRTKNVNKPDAPQSPQISICARDLMRDIFVSELALYLCWHRSAATRSRTQNRPTDFHCPQKCTHFENNAVRREKTQTQLSINLSHRICPLYLSFCFCSDCVFPPILYTFADVLQLMQFKSSEIYGNGDRISMANGWQNAVVSVKFIEILSDCK